jgi:hypothetical protein
MVAECEQRVAEKLAAHQSAQIDTQRARERLEALKTECKELAQSFYDDCLSLVSDEPIAKLEEVEPEMTFGAPPIIGVNAGVNPAYLNGLKQF